MIGIGGLARAGKDTLASDLSEIIKADMGVDVKIFSLAWPVKCQLNDLFESYYHLSREQYGVSDNAIKNWCKSYAIPHLKQELKQWYKEQTE